MLADGSKVGNYVVESMVGSGGMSAVYRARHRALGSYHAIKILSADLNHRPDVRGRFLKEGQVLAQLRHPALVRVTDVIDEPGIPAGLVMDFLNGQDLAARLQDKALDLETASSILLQVLSGVGHAHQSKVVHRDLKPANIFLVPRGEPRVPYAKVLDFGIAKVADVPATQAASTMGTVAYMSPEQIQNPGQVDARSDVFSLGVMLFEMVSGAVPFPGDTEFGVMQRIVAGDREPLPASAAGLEPLIRQALHADPAERFQTAAEFASALRPFAAAEVRLMVDDWEGSGELTVDPESQLGAPSTSAPDGAWLAPAAPPKPPAVLTEARKREVVRLMGSLQLTSGVFNIFVMSAVQCLGIGWLGGLPACFGGLLLIVGCFEVLSGLNALAFGNPRWIRPTALLEVISLAGAGVVSAVVGMVVLFVRKRHPQALP